VPGALELGRLWEDPPLAISRRLVLPLAASGAAIVLGGLLRIRTAAKESQSGRSDPIDQLDPFPLDGRVRVFDTHDAPGATEGFIAFERVAVGRKMLRDGQNYSIFETRVVNKGTGERRVVSREWLRRTAEGIFCARRQEGPLTSDLDPPQPILLLPLMPGRRWSWSGLVGGLECTFNAVVSGRGPARVGAGVFSEAWRVDMVSTSGDRECVRRTLWIQLGIGLIAERAHIERMGRILELDATLRSITG